MENMSNGSPERRKGRGTKGQACSHPSARTQFIMATVMEVGELQVQSHLPKETT